MLKIYTISVAIWMCIIAAAAILSAILKVGNHERGGERKWKRPWLAFFLLVLAVSCIPVVRLCAAVRMIKKMVEED